MKNNIEIYTDGSCNHREKIGSWAVILLYQEKNIVLHGKTHTSSHNSMELTAVIKSIEYIKTQRIPFKQIKIFTDSQYVTDLTQRKNKLKSSRFQTKKGNPIKNIDLVKKLIAFIETFPLEFIKVKAHQKKTKFENYNRTVDKLSRKIIRDHVKKNHQ